MAQTQLHLLSFPQSKCYFPNPKIPSSSARIVTFPKSSLSAPKTHFESLPETAQNELINIPTMAEILASSKAQNLDLQLQTLGPFFRITAKSLETGNELGRAEGLIRVWLGGRLLHLDSIRLNRETLGMKKSIFGIGLFIGAVAVRYGYDCGCKTAQLLAINDSDLYHTKVCKSFIGGINI